MIDPEQREILAEELIRDEGLKLYAYQDSEGYWTIGIGRLIDKKRGGGISREEAFYLFDNDLREKEADLDRYLPWWRALSPARQRVLLNMCFNMGIGNSKEGLRSFKNTLAAMERGDYEAAARGMKASKWAKQVGERADRLIEMMKNG